MRCPGFEKLVDYIDGRLDKTGAGKSEAAGIAAHLASGCQACRDNLRWYERVRGLAATDDQAEPPPWVFKQALKIFETGRARPGLVERLGRQVASLVFDSQTRPLIAGVRSTAAANRQLLYRAADYSIDLQIAPLDESRADLIGQILRADEPAFESAAGRPLELLREGETVRSAVTNETGEFALNALDCGTYDLRITTPEGSITIPDLRIERI